MAAEKGEKVGLGRLNRWLTRQQNSQKLKGSTGMAKTHTGMKFTKLYQYEIGRAHV